LEQLPSITGIFI